MIFVGGCAFAQKTAHFKANWATLHILPPFQTLTYKISMVSNYNAFKVDNYKSIIAANYYTSNFGFFCKKELQFEKATKIPFKFRLGSVQQCDWLEGKGGK